MGKYEIKNYPYRSVGDYWSSMIGRKLYSGSQILFKIILPKHEDIYIVFGVTPYQSQSLKYCNIIGW